MFETAHSITTPAVSAPLSGVPIRRVHCRVFRAPSTDNVAMSFAPLTHRVMVVIELEFEDGTSSAGETWANYPSWAWQERRATVEHGVAPLLVGEAFTSTSEAHDLMTTRLGALGRQWGAPGPIRQAISAVDVALWTRAAEERGVPLGRLLASETRGELPVYASSLGPTGVEATAHTCLELNIHAVKVKVGFGRETDEANLAATRRVLGDEARLFADANQAWTPSEALAMAPVLTEFGVEWIEEPIAGDDAGELSRFGEAAGLAVATGENLYGAAAFHDYIDQPSIRIVQPDVSKVGGVTDYWRVVQYAAPRGTLVAPHLYNGALATAATLQVAAANPTTPWVEWDIRSNRLREPIGHVLTDHGTVLVPQGPGLGVHIDFESLSDFEETL
ncbi:mandelate racemase/muconate lactonizing enzyme family protein [Glaciibacter superstes]|uniref:mandelate racemase/muconate lactonizing enzyme family protein n=1 Tax=Glaciibacter superstes TaxID=501023 RepID=UPI0003B2FEAF|nr:mandelate racemase/muconate lactonizing enzyme family protein [Glaciibacter superstes]